MGTVLINNIFNSNAAGGVTIIGDVSNSTRPVVDAPVVRVINNSFFGTRNKRCWYSSDQTVRHDRLEQHIFSNYSTAIAVDAASGSTVVGANIFKTNANNGVLGRSRFRCPQPIPLYVNPTNGNFYLAAGSQAIDSPWKPWPNA